MVNKNAVKSQVSLKKQHKWFETSADWCFPAITVNTLTREFIDKMTTIDKSDATNSPKWKKPDEVMALHRLKRKKKALQVNYWMYVILSICMSLWCIQWIGTHEATFAQLPQFKQSFQ